MLQRTEGSQRFQLYSLVGGTVEKKAAGKFTTHLGPGRQPDTAAVRLSDQEQTMSVLHKAFGGDVSGPETRRAATALGITSQDKGDGMLELNLRMNVQFLALQSTLEQWNRKGASLSSASKARHDSAMAAVRNMK